MYKCSPMASELASDRAAAESVEVEEAGENKEKHKSNFLWHHPGSGIEGGLTVPAAHCQLLTFTERCTHGLVAAIRRWSRFWFTHVFLLAILLSYAALGAWMFWGVEGPHENQEKVDILRMREHVQLHLLNLSRRTVNDTQWITESRALFTAYEAQLYKAYSVGISTDPEKTLWTFWGAVFYCGTVVSTIGYGHIVPSTTAGRALTMVYATIGIPLLLMVLADFGKLLTKGIKMLWSVVHRFRQTKSWRKLRRTLPIKAITGSAAGEANGPEVQSRNSRHEQEYCEDGGQYEIDDEFNLPAWVAISLLLSYIMLGACMFIQWEKNWSYFEAFYFVFISMSTIGFGDYVPEHPIFMMGTFVYLLFGLALMSMCINIIQESLTSTFRQASEKLRIRMGIEMQTAQSQSG